MFNHCTVTHFCFSSGVKAGRLPRVLLQSVCIEGDAALNCRIWKKVGFEPHTIRSPIFMSVLSQMLADLEETLRTFSQPHIIEKYKFTGKACQSMSSCFTM